jgi:Flp pilus assembly protein TadG
MSLLKRLANDRGGNFGIMTAILLPVLCGAAGVAIDVSNMMLSKRELQEATDAAALAAATALSRDSGMTPENAKTLALNYVKGQMANSVPSATLANITKGTDATITTTTTSDGKRYDIKVTSDYAMPLTPFMQVFGRTTTNIAAASSTTSGVSQTKSALSMTLVLDESGSMLANTGEKVKPTTNCKQYNDSGQLTSNSATCYIKKIEALQTAANLLLDQLDKADPSSRYVRTNAIAWSSQIQDSSTFAWGTKQTRTGVIDTMKAGGNTNSAPPMAKAYADLVTTNSSSETSIHTAAGNKTLTKYIVFMTDGNNNNDSSNTATLDTCTSAKEDGIKIYSIAFMAPTKAQKFLNSCSSGTGFYFKAESMADLLQAFTAIGEEASATKTLLTQ